MEKIRIRFIREVAAIAIYQHILVGDNFKDIQVFIRLNKELKKNPEEVEYCIDFVTNIINDEEALKTTIQNNLKEGWTNERLSKMELAILLVASYELLTLKNNKQIVINEAVELTKKYCDHGSYKYINGVLNKL